MSGLIADSRTMIDKARVEAQVTLLNPTCVAQNHFLSLYMN